MQFERAALCARGASTRTACVPSSRVASASVGAAPRFESQHATPKSSTHQYLLPIMHDATSCLHAATVLARHTLQTTLKEMQNMRTLAMQTRSGSSCSRGSRLNYIGTSASLGGHGMGLLGSAARRHVSLIAACPPHHPLARPMSPFAGTQYSHEAVACAIPSGGAKTSGLRG